MKKIFASLCLLGALVLGWTLTYQTHWDLRLLVSSNQTLSSAFREHRSGVQVVGEGIVTRLLPDDVKGRRHQRFVVTLSSGQMLIVAHNIDLAPRVKWLQRGDSLAFSGVYEWNETGGVIHWTHHDPRGRHTPGWLWHRGQYFQ